MLLERIMHPAIMAREEEAMAEWERSGLVEVAIVEEALLIEVGSAGRFHRVLLVVATPEAQLKRLMEKGLTQEEALSRISAQMPLSEKTKYADYLIENSGTLREAERKVKELYPILGEEARRLSSSSRCNPG
jgi:dephospho-CoA kinase